MKKLRLSLQQLSNVEVLSREQLKTLYGGDGSGAGSGNGSCLACYCGSTMSSCYYTTSPSTLCERVYPNCNEDLYARPIIDCKGCIMN
ncbi:hypothetical protein ACTJJ0_21060 [Chitinophaga sp. 22321]|uniref:Natural product n=1 Tax=Chitinophaga hostae TaxID=2831022 RepID=A0ABS5J415_9BACT|nr:hypothetical protein [Chitinophaga hostae]MBS0029977.1 hypothetical protein [Chitinophaga hostae]